jgi:hypothetical protein
MEFLKDITEARMYRRLQQLTGRSVDDLASQTFTHLLMLRSLYDLDKPKAVNYAKDIVSNLNFSGFRASMPDLYNMLVMIIEQHKYADKLFNNWEVTVPEMRIKRVFRSMAQGELDSNDFAQLMLILQRKFPNIDGDQMRMRRMVQDTTKSTPSDRKWMQKRLLQMSRKIVNSDLHQLYQQVSGVKLDK